MPLSSIIDNSLSLSDRAADQIIKYIHENQLQEGDRLPVEAELMERFQVSRSTVREAVRTLSSRNIVLVRRGRGTYVSHSVVEDPLGLNFVHDRNKLVQDILELRMMLEPANAAFCAERATEQEIQELWQLHKQVEAQIRRKENHTVHDVAFHCKIAECTRNDIIKILQPEISKGVTIFIAYTKELLYEQTIDTHRQIVQAIQDRDRQAAFDAMLQHLKYNQEVLSHIDFNQDDAE